MIPLYGVVLFGLSSGAGFSQSPQVSANGMVNAASLQPGSLAPGEIITVFGAGLGPDQLVVAQPDSNGRFSSTLSGVTVLMNEQPAPLLAVRADQINAIVPSGLGITGPVRVEIRFGLALSNPTTLPLARSAPGLFTLSSTGKGSAAALNQDLTLNEESNPAARDSVVTLYATGGGLTVPPSDSARIASAPLPSLIEPVQVQVGGYDARVLYKGAAPGLVTGLLQVNVELPPHVPGGPAVPVLLRVGNVPSQPGVTLAIVPTPGSPTLTLQPLVTFPFQEPSIRIGISAAQSAPVFVRLISTNPAIAAVPESAVIPARENFITIKLTRGGINGSVTILAELPNDLGGDVKTLNLVFGEALP